LLALLGAAPLVVGLVVLIRGPQILVRLLLVVGVCAAAVMLARSARLGLSSAIVLIAAFPVLRVELGPLPLYALDAVIALGLVAVAVAATDGRGGAYGVWIVVYLLSWVPAWVVQVFSLGVILEPTYGLLRNALSVGAFFVSFAAVRQYGLRVFGPLLAAAVLATSLLAVMQVVSGTRGAVRGLLLSLSPDFTPTAYHVYPKRAFALLTAPTTLAGLLAVCVPLLLAFFASSRGFRRVLVTLAIVSSGGALIATYSRQWLPALALGFVVLALLNRRLFGRSLLAAGAVIAAVWLLLAGGALDHAYLGQRFGMLGREDVNVQTRLQSQRDFVALARNDAQAFLVGRGFAGQDLVRRGVVDRQTAEQILSGRSENAFLLEVFNHGLFAGLLYLGLLVAVFARVARAARSGSVLAAGVAGALASAITLHFFDNYFSEAIFMKALLWVLLGSAVALGGNRMVRE
jgi:hypothetical protein